MAFALVLAVAAPIEGNRRSSDIAALVPAPLLDQWPGWRGLTAEGRAARPLPTRWDAEEGIRWKAPIPGRGHSSPIVIGDRVYVSTADLTTSGRTLQTLLQFLSLVVAL